MKVYRYLSPKKIYFFNPFFVIGNCFIAPIEHSANPKRHRSESRQSRLAIASVK